MLRHFENGIRYVTDLTIEDTGANAIINFNRFVFLDRFYIEANGNTLTEGVDYLRILKSREGKSKLGIDVFGGIVLLFTEAVTLSIYAVDSVEHQYSLPPTTLSPYTVIEYAPPGILTGSYDELVSSLDELNKLIPFIEGNTLPYYVVTKLDVIRPEIEYIDSKIALGTITIDTAGVQETNNNPVPARSDFMHTIDSLPVDYSTS